MYRPPAFREDSPEILHAAIRANPLGTLITHGAGGLTANLVPFTLTADGALLRAHLGNNQRNVAEMAVTDDVVKRVWLWRDIDPFYPDQTRGIGKTSESRGVESVLNALVLATRDQDKATGAIPARSQSTRIASLASMPIPSCQIRRPAWQRWPCAPAPDLQRLHQPFAYPLPEALRADATPKTVRLRHLTAPSRRAPPRRWRDRHRAPSHRRARHSGPLPPHP